MESEKNMETLGCSIADQIFDLWRTRFWWLSRSIKEKIERKWQSKSKELKKRNGKQLSVPFQPSNCLTLGEPPPTKGPVTQGSRVRISPSPTGRGWVHGVVVDHFRFNDEVCGDCGGSCFHIFHLKLCREVQFGNVRWWGPCIPRAQLCRHCDASSALSAPPGKQDKT